MGVRISAYSVDLSRLDRFLDTTLGNLLLLYVQQASVTNRAFNWRNFHAIPQKGVFHPALPGQPGTRQRGHRARFAGGME